jgi:hypothetical protein
MLVGYLIDQAALSGVLNALYDQEIGFCHFKSGNLPKSPSAEHKISPCSIAGAAR